MKPGDEVFDDMVLDILSTEDSFTERVIQQVVDEVHAKFGGEAGDEPSFKIMQDALDELVKDGQLAYKLGTWTWIEKEQNETN